MQHNIFYKNLIVMALTLSMFGLTGCLSSSNGALTEATDNSSSATPEEPSTEPETPDQPDQPDQGGATREATPLWESKVADGKEWTTHVDKTLDTLGQNLLDVIPADKNLFCPKYAGLSYAQRKQYWTYIISSMVRFESNFNTNTSYTEDFDDSSGNNVISRGLLQISIESGNAYGCGFKTSKDLHDPYQNLSCGIRILDRWVGRDGRIAGKVGGTWRGGARYWSVLREGDKTSYKSILKWSQELPFCN